MKNSITFLTLCLAVACAISACSKPKKRNLLRQPQTTLSSATNAPDAPIAIKLKWIPNERYVVQVEAVVGLDVTVPGTNEPKKIVYALNQDHSILAGKTLADGGQELDWQITAQRFFFQPAEHLYLIFDDRQSAAQDAADPLSPRLRKLLNVPIKIVTDANGKLVRTDGLDALTASLEAGDSQSQMALQTKAAMQSLLTEQNLRGMLDVITALQPSDAVKLGQSWPVQFPLAMPGTGGATVNLHCTLADWDRQDNRECLRIEFKGDVAAKAGYSDGAAATKVEAGTITGTAWYDPELGTLLNATLEGHVTATTFALGQTLPSRLNLTSNLRLLSVEEK